MNAEKVQNKISLAYQDTLDANSKIIANLDGEELLELVDQLGLASDRIEEAIEEIEKNEDYIEASENELANFGV